MTTKRICSACRHLFPVEKVLTAPHPFIENEYMLGCPNCKAADTVRFVCDEEGCDEEQSCGWPSPDGYRNTCWKHSKFKPKP